MAQNGGGGTAPNANDSRMVKTIKNTKHIN
jgi:hypothetical protein